MVRERGHSIQGNPGVVLAAFPLRTIRNFWKKVAVPRLESGAPDFSQCWPWIGAQTKGIARYGHLRVGPKTWMKAHRFVLALFTGCLPDDQDAAHECHNKLCVNPSHLKWEGHKENVLETFERHGALHLRGKKQVAEKVLCMNCDGTGWCEGSPAFECRDCNGTGEVAA